MKMEPKLSRFNIIPEHSKSSTNLWVCSRVFVGKRDAGEDGLPGRLRFGHWGYCQDIDNYEHDDNDNDNTNGDIL